MSKGNLAAAAQPFCQQLADQMGFALVEVALEKEPAGKYLRIYLDRPGGINLNDCEAYHRRIQPQLESLDYDFLEVCSPGLDRPLKTPEDYVRNSGNQVEVRLFQPVGKKKVHQGQLVGLLDGQVVIENAQGQMRFDQKSVALVKPLIDMTGVEDAELEE